MRIALGVEYDGRPYCGWQSQADGQTVQDTLQHVVFFQRQLLIPLLRLWTGHGRPATGLPAIIFASS